LIGKRAVPCLLPKVLNFHLAMFELSKRFWRNYAWEFENESLYAEIKEIFEKRGKSRNKSPLSAVFMLVSSFFCRSVASSQHMAVVSFAENGPAC
jgi:uncharacterized membrane protein YbaN (DUF454 family)